MATRRFNQSSKSGISTVYDRPEYSGPVKYLTKRERAKDPAEILYQARKAKRLAKAVRKEQKEREAAQWKATLREREHSAPGWYGTYLKSEHWMKFRLEILSRRGTQCQDCGVAGKGINLHHVTYVRLGGERPDDVRVLCERCHKKRHFGSSAPKGQRTEQRVDTLDGFPAGHEHVTPVESTAPAQRCDAASLLPAVVTSGPAPAR